MTWHSLPLGDSLRFARGAGKAAVVATLILICGLILTFGLARFHDGQNREIARQQLELRGYSLAETLEKRLVAFRQGLFGMRAGIWGKDPAAGYRDYANGLDLAAEYPGILAHGFALRVGQDSVSREIAQLEKRQGLKIEFSAESVNRSDRYLIVEASDVQQLGIDLAAIQPARTAGLRSVWVGDAILSQPVHRAGVSSPVFYYVLPVFASPKPPSTVEAREREVVGWLYLLISGEKLMAGINDESLMLRLLDRDNPDEELPIFSSSGGLASDSQTDESLHWDFEHVFGSRQWVFSVQPTERFWQSLRLISSTLTQIGGVLLSLLLSLLIWSLMTSRLLAERRAREMTEALHVSEHRVRSILNYASIGIGFFASNRLLQCNPRWAENFGYASSGELAGLSASAFWKDEASYSKAIGEAWPMLVSGEVFERECELRREDGSLFWAKVTARALYPEDPSLGTIWITEDITARLAAKRELLESRQQLAQIVECSPIATFVLDAEHRITHWNPACASLTGISAAEMLGRTDAWHPFYPEERVTMANLVLAGADDDTVAQYYERSRRSSMLEGAIQAEGFFPSMGEGGVWLYFMAALLRDSEGRLVGAIETLQDVTARRSGELQLEARVRERTEALEQQLHFLGQLIEAIPGPMYYLDSAGRYLGFNTAFAECVGSAGRALVGELAAGDAVWGNALDGDGRDLLAAPGQAIFESSVVLADGRQHAVMLHKATVTRADGGVGGLVGMMLDITERKGMEDDLRQAATVFENASEGGAVVGICGRILAVNQAFLSMTGFAKEDLLGASLGLFETSGSESDVFTSVFGQVSTDTGWAGELRCRRKNGTAFPARLSIAAVSDRDGCIASYVAISSDISTQKENELRIATMAFHDSLTGLPNRRFLRERLLEAIKRCQRDQMPAALLFIDLDNFKSLNDTLGHDIGDLLLRQVAKLLRELLREVDTVARLGGDEFVVILEGLGDSADEAADVVKTMGEKIVAHLGRTYQLGSFSHRCTPSLGATVFVDDRSSLDELLKQADLALYQAKADGRNRMCFYDPGMQALVQRRGRLEEALRVAIQDEALELHYQPQVVGAGRVVGAEVLARWRHADLGPVSPGEFIPVAEESGLIVPLGRWILRTVCRQLAEWAKTPMTASLSLAVNVSAVQFEQEGFVDEVTASLREFGAPPQRLKLELTESVFLDHGDLVIGRMMQLKALGISFSLDDFGTGYSSLHYLKRLPLDQLKIDQSFVRDILCDHNDAAIARTVVALAGSFGMNVIAEGVELKAQMDFLAHLGCHAYQGYLFGRPAPLAEFQAQLGACYREGMGVILPASE